MNQLRHERRVLDIYALFVYATLIVDLYRKFSGNVAALPLSVDMFRNIVYVLLFLGIVLTEKRVMQFVKLITIGIVFAFLTLFSWLINWERNAGSLFLNLIFMFVSRLLPAYYIGTKLVGKEEQFIAAVNRWQWLTVLYIGLVLAYPEVSETSYLTISGNVLIPALIGLFGTTKGMKHIVPKLVGLAGLFVILVYGGRTYLVAVVLTIALLFLVQMANGTSSKRMLLFVGSIAVAILLMIFFEDIIAYLYKQNPTSRTLRLMAKGEFFWASNRENYYDAAYKSFMNNPFKIYGFLGDRFYYYDTFNSAGGNEYAATMFSHNTLLELMLNFGVFIGAGIIGFFLYKIGNHAGWQVHPGSSARRWAPHHRCSPYQSSPGRSSR